MIAPRIQEIIEGIKKPKGTIVPLSAEYGNLYAQREGYLIRGKEYSQMTLRYILPWTTENMNTTRGDDGNDFGYTSFGAQAVNNLANRMMHNLFPAHQPFFALDWTEEERQKLTDAGYDPNELAQALRSSVRKVTEYEGSIDARPTLINALKHLIISGNVCLYVPPDGGRLQAIPLSHYVVTRAVGDDLISLATKQVKALCTFDEEIQALIKQSDKGKWYKDDQEIELISYAVRKDDDTFLVAQTANDILLATAQEVKEDDLPWKPLRWDTCYGEDYGRGLCEAHASDLRAMHFLAEALAKGMMLMADVKYLVKAGAITDIDELATSPTGEYLVGSIDDVTVLQLEKYADFTPIVQTLQMYEKRIGQSFLMQSGVVRDSERTTAYEIRMQAQELNEALGGIYSHLATTLQKPYAHLLMKRTGFPLGKDQVSPHIVTGMEALAKASDLDKLRVFTESIGLSQAWSPELIARTDSYRMAHRIANAIGLDLDFIRNDEEQAAVDQAAQQNAQQQNLMAEASKAAPKVIEQGAAQMMGGM